jgi:hypothetical protein
VKINYRNFKKEITLKDSIELNPIYVSTKNTSNKQVVDESTGEVSELELNEQKDEKVNYVYNGNNIGDYYRRGEPLSEDVSTKHSSNDIEYGVINYNDDDCGDPTSSVSTLTVLANSEGAIYNGVKGTYLSDFSETNVPIIPMHNNIKEDKVLSINSGNSFTNPSNKSLIAPSGQDNINDIISSGLYPFFNFSIDSASKYASKNKDKITPISKKNFDVAISRLTEVYKESKISIAVTRYSEKLNEDDVDTNDSFISRKLIRKKKGLPHTEMKKALDSFVKAHDELENPVEDDISPFSLSVKEVSRAFINASPDELIDELISACDAIFELNGESYDIDRYIGIDVDDLFEKINKEPTGVSFITIPRYNLLRNRITSIIDKMSWYETYVGVPVNFKYQRFGDSNVAEPMTSFLTPEKLHQGTASSDSYYQHNRLARYLIPVDYGIRKVRVPTDFIFPKYEYIDDGIRWILVEFYNADTFDKFRQNTKPSGNSSGESDSDGCDVKEDLPSANSSDNDLTEDVLVTFDMPSLPYDSELRNVAFNTYGYFDQSEYSIRDNVYEGADESVNPSSWDSTSNDGRAISEANGTPINTSIDFSEVLDGFTIFPEDSKEISDMRDIYGIQEKVQFLINILKTEFGSNNVKITSTVRSSETQNKKQLGGASSNMLSWHNYGLAVKIGILGSDGLTLIDESSEEYPKLYEIARNFTNACKQGFIGEPCNLVWCGQLKTGADIFDWEFLPVGIGHKDIHIFRDSIYNQKDSIIDNLYVNADSYVKENKPLDDSPYILRRSNVYKKAILYNEIKYVPYKKIRNLKVPSNLVLKDLQEFIYLVNNKKLANGDTISGITLKSWKLANPISYKQLILYNSLIGNYEFVKSLMAIDYIEEYSQYMLGGNVTNSDEFLQDVLGNYSYSRIKIKLSSENDGKYMSVSDGKVRIPSNKVKSSHPAGNGNTFGEKQIDENNYEYIESDDLVSENPAISDDQLEYLKDQIKDSVIREFNDVKATYESITNNLMFDKLLDGNNKDNINLLENEFGIISTQDVLPFDVLDNLYKKDSDSVGVDYNGNVRDSRGEIYEKMVSNAQENGVQVAELGKEKPVIEPMENITKQEAFTKLFGTGAVNVRDIL